MARAWRVVSIALVLSACGAASPSPPRSATVKVLVQGAGFCTHVAMVPDPECDPRPLSGAAVELVDSGGHVVARGVSGEDGVVSLTVPPAPYALVPMTVSGFDLTPAPMPLDARAGQTLEVVLTHNTGYQ